MNVNGLAGTVKTLLVMAGQESVITVHRAFVDFTGSLEAALMLNQLLYWTGRAIRQDGFIYKSDEEWQHELCLTRYSVRAARARLESIGILETKRMRANGAPTTHYRLKIEALTSAWQRWLGERAPSNTNSGGVSRGVSENAQSIVRNQTIHCSNPDNPGSENAQCITETTTETTTEREARSYSGNHLAPIDPFDHPAVQDYRAVFGAPDIFQAELIAGCVVDRETWREDLKYWRGNQNRKKNVYTLLQRHRESVEKQRSSQKSRPSPAPVLSGAKAVDALMAAQGRIEAQSPGSKV